MAHNTISVLVREVCDAIIQEYGQEVVCLPADTETSLKVIKAYVHWYILYFLSKKLYTYIYIIYIYIYFLGQ